MLVDLPNSRSILTANGTREYKIVVVGPRKVGKSALVVRFLTKRFISEYVENTDMACKGTPDVDGELLRVNIQDTSDKGLRLSSVEHHFRWADAIMMVYSITDPESFRQLKDTAMRIVEKSNDLVDKEHSRIPPLVVVGNKGDLDYVRKVSRQEGYELAEKLRCDFFEASAREGWSKGLSRSDIYSGTCSPPSDSETLSIFAGTTATIGLVGMPTCGTTPEIRRCSTPPLSRACVQRGRSPSRNRNELPEPQNPASLKRWTSITSEKHHRIHRSCSTTGAGLELYGSTIPRVSITRSGTRQNSLPCSPNLSEEDNEEPRLTGLLCPIKERKISTHGGLIGRLSPRLGRRFSRSNKNEEKLMKKMFRDDNNNKQKSKSLMNNISTGLSSSLVVGAGVGDAGFRGIVGKQVHSNNNSCGSSTASSTNTSATQSTENLVLCGQELDYRQSVNTPLINVTNSTVTNVYPLSDKLPYCEIKLQESDFGSSEPFLYLCRGRTSKTRVRSRSPSRKLISSLKRIRSLASDHSNQTNNRHPCNNSGYLSVPVIRS